MLVNNTSLLFENCSESYFRCNFWKLEYTEEYAIEYILNVYVAPILSFIIVVLGSIGNSSVIYVVIKNPQMRTTTNMFVTSLAIADLTLTTLCLPFKAMDYVLPYWIFGDFMCKLIPYLVVVSVYSSVYTLVFTSLDRFLALVVPLKTTHIRTKLNACIVIMAIWILSAAFSFPVFQGHGVMTYGNSEFSDCTFLVPETNVVPAIDGQLLYALTAYFIPLGLIFCLYMLILKKLWCESTLGDHICAKRLQNKKRVTVMIIVVVIVLAVCWAPVITLMFLEKSHVYKISPAYVSVEIMAFVFAYANSCMNPFIYAFMSQSFRAGFKKVIRKDSKTYVVSLKT